MALTVGTGVASAGNQSSWDLNTTEDWRGGSFDGTDAWNDRLQLVANPSENWTTATVDNAMMVDVHDGINDSHFVYTVDNDGVYMANQENGSSLWSSIHGSESFNADSARIGVRFVYNGNDHNIWAYDHNGNEVYNPSTSGEISSSYVESVAPDFDQNGFFYVGNEDDPIDVFDKETGSNVADLTHPAISGSSSYDSSIHVDPSGDILYLNNNSHTLVFTIQFSSGVPDGLSLEAVWPVQNGHRDDYDSDSVYADSQYFYFSGDAGNVSVVEKGTWTYVANISATGANVWSVDSDGQYVYYAAHDGFVYIHKKSQSDGFPLVTKIDVGSGSQANSVDGDNQQFFYATNGGEVGAYHLFSQNGNYENSFEWDRLKTHENVTVNATINSQVTLVVRSDIDDDGTFDDSKTIDLQNGHRTYSLSDLDDGFRTKIEFQLDTDSGQPSPMVHDVRVNVQEAEINTSSVDVDTSNIPVESSGESDSDSTDGDQESEQEQEQEEQQQEDADDGGETITAVQTTQENGQTQVQATVQDAQGGEPVEMQVASDTEADVDPETAPAQLTSVSITPANDATFSLEITESPEPLDSSPEFNLGDGTTPVSYLSVEHSLPNTEIQQASMTYRVSEQSLEAMDSSPEDVSMYRYDGESWAEQPTQVVGMDDGAAILQATADGLSEWTAAAKRPRLNVTDTQVSVQAATTEEEVTIQVFVTNTGGTDGVYEAELLLNEETVDRTERTVPDGGTVAVNFERTFGQPGLYEVQVNDVFVGEVNISAADETVEVETAANASIEAQEPANATEADGGGGGFPVLPAGIVLVLAAALGIWLYMTRFAE